MRVLGASTIVLAAFAGLVACSGNGAPPVGNDAPPKPPRAASSPPSWVPPAATTTAPIASAVPDPMEEPEIPEDPAAAKARVVTELAGRRPRAWGMSIAGVLTHAVTDEASIALTFDACGGAGGDGYDGALIDYLRREKVPATLFLTSKWIAAQRATAKALAADPLFEIENHGSAHRPCSVSGRSAWGIRGTRSVGDAVDEIQRGSKAIFDLTGRAPRFYRPGTAYFDDVCLDVIGALGQSAAGFAVNGDGGTGFSRSQVKDALVKAKSGSIVLLHMNHPGGATAEGVKDAIPILRARGVKLVLLRDAKLR